MTCISVHFVFFTKIVPQDISLPFAAINIPALRSYDVIPFTVDDVNFISLASKPCPTQGANAINVNIFRFGLYNISGVFFRKTEFEIRANKIVIEILPLQSIPIRNALRCGLSHIQGIVRIHKIKIRPDCNICPGSPINADAPGCFFRFSPL